jgi:hypothetical protein
MKLQLPFHSAVQTSDHKLETLFYLSIIGYFSCHCHFISRDKAFKMKRLSALFVGAAKRTAW